MKTIRFKVKHLLLIVIAAVVLIGFGDTIFWSGIGFYNRIMPESYAIDINNFEPGTVEGENARLNLLLSEQNYNLYDLVTVSEGATTPSSHIQRVSSKKVYDQYLSFGAEEDLLSEYPEYIINVALIQWFSGNMEKTEEIMKTIDPEELDDADRDNY